VFPDLVDTVLTVFFLPPEVVVIVVFPTFVLTVVLAPFLV
jgi:hypothetical protein